MTTVNIEEAQADLIRLIDQALAGEPFLIAREGKPVVQVSAVGPASTTGRNPRRQLGFADGMFPVPADIKGPYRDEIEDMFGLKDL